MERIYPLLVVLSLASAFPSASGGSALWPAVAILLAVLALLSAWRQRDRPGVIPFVWKALLPTLLIAAGTIGLWLNHLAARDDDHWLRVAREHLDSGAELAADMMAGLELEARARAQAGLDPQIDLATLAQPLSLAGASLDVGVSIWEAEGILRWAGAVPGPDRAAATPYPLIIDHGFRRYLSVSEVSEGPGLSRDSSETRICYVDVSLGITRELFPRLGVGEDPGGPMSQATGLFVQVLAQPPRPDDVVNLERVIGVPEEDPWVWLSVRSPGAREARRDALRGAGRLLAWTLLLALLLSALLVWRSWGGRQVEPRRVGLSLVLVALVVAARWAMDRVGLLDLAFASDRGTLRWVLEPAYFATTWGFGLLRSVLDFLVTAIALAFALLLLLPAWLRAMGAQDRLGRVVAGVVLFFFTVGMTAWNYTLQEVVAQNANPKLTGLDAPFFTLPFQLLHLSLLLAMIAPAGFALLGWERWLRGASRRAPSVALVSGALLCAWVALTGGSFGQTLLTGALPVLAVLISPTVRHPSFSVRIVAGLTCVLWLAWVQTEGLRDVYERLKESVATERAQDRLYPRDNWRRVLVEELLRELSEDLITLRGLADSSRDRSNAAFELWAGSGSLSALGYGSRIVVLDRSGQVISDFDLGLPYQPRAAFSPRHPFESGELYGVSALELRTEHGLFLIYRGRLDVASIFPTGDAGWLLVDLPYATLDPAAPVDLSPGGRPAALGFSSHRELLAPRQEFERPVIIGRLGADAVVAATDPTLVGLSAELIPEHGGWAKVSLDGQPFRARRVRDESGEELVVAFALPTAADRLLDASRLVAMYLLVGALGILLLVVASRIRPGPRRRWPQPLGQLGYQERLLGALVLVVLLPVIVSGVFHSRRATGRLQRANMEEVASRLDTALRLLATQLDETAEALIEGEYMQSILSGEILAPRRELGSFETIQAMVFRADGSLRLDESLRDLDNAGARLLLEQLLSQELILERDSSGWYLGRLYPEGAGPRHYIFVRRAIDDEELGSLARTVGTDLTLYDGPWAAVSSRDDLYKAGLVTPVLPAAAQQVIRNGGSQRYVEAEPRGGLMVATGYAAIRGLVEPRRGVLAARLFAEATEAALEQRRSYLFLFGLSSLAFLLAVSLGLLVAARTVHPIKTLVSATRRVGGGDLEVRLPEGGDDEIGELMRSFNQMTDDLQQSQLSLASRRGFLEAMLENLSVGVMVLDENVIERESNRAAGELLAKDPSQLLAHVRALGPPDEVTATEIALPGDSGPRTLRTVITPIQLESGGAGWLLLFDDVTELLATRQLTVYAEMARQVAHEIKNPLTPIQLAAQMVRQACHDDHPAMDRIVDDNVGRIETQVARLREIASEFSLLGRQDLPGIEPVALAPLLAEVQALYPSADNRLTVRAHSENGLRVMASREALIKILTNLVENGIQAMNGQGGIRLNAEKAGDRAILRVEDEGPGIAPELQDRLFEAYFSTKSSGTGLGLMICRNLMEKMGGRIELTNREDGRGAVAVLELPLVLAADDLDGT